MYPISWVNVYRLSDALNCLEIDEQGPRKEIFLKGFELVDKFFTEFGAGGDDVLAENVQGRLKEIDNILEDIFKMIRNLIKNLDPNKNENEVIFWQKQMKKLSFYVDNHMKAVKLKQLLLKNPKYPRTEKMERFLCLASDVLKDAGIDLEGFGKINGENWRNFVKAYVSEVEASDTEDGEGENMVDTEGENQFDKIPVDDIALEDTEDTGDLGQLSEVEGLDVFGKPIDQNLEEGKIETSNLKDLDVFDTKKVALDLNKEGAAVEDEQKNDPINPITGNVVDEGSDGDTDEDVQGYDEISVSRKDDQCNNKVNEDILDNFEDPAVDVGDNFKVKVEDLNEFIEAEVGRNVVKLLFEGTFEENSEEILENLDKFPEPEIEFEEHEENVSETEPKVETIAVEIQLHNDLDGSLDKIPKNFEDDGKASKDDNMSITVVKNVAAVRVKKSGADRTVVKEPDPYVNAVIAGNILHESKTNVKDVEEEHENPASSSLKALKFKSLGRLEELIHIRKVATNAYNAIIMYMYGFDRQHKFVVAEFLVITSVIKPMEVPINYFLLMYDVTGLDIFKKSFSFPWRPGDQLCWVCYPAMLFMLVLQLLIMLKEFRVDSVMTTAVMAKSGMKAEHCEVELVHPKPSMFVSLLDDDDTDQGQEEHVLVD